MARKELRKTSLASIESLGMPFVQEVVLSADFQCVECEKRVADMISRMNEIESVVVNVSEKKVTLICRYPSQRVALIRRNSFSRVAMFMRIFRSPQK